MAEVNQVMTLEAAGISIDRSRISHGEAAKASLAAAKLQKLMKDLDAGKDIDFDELERLMDRTDESIAQIVVSVPEGWLPDGVTVGAAGWIKRLPQDKYELLTQTARAPETGSPKA